MVEPSSTASMNDNLHTNTHVPRFSCKYFRTRLSKQTNKRNTFLYLAIRVVGAKEEFRDKQVSLFYKFKARTLDLNFGYVPPGADECWLMHFSRRRVRCCSHSTLGVLTGEGPENSQSTCCVCVCMCLTPCVCFDFVSLHFVFRKQKRVC